MILSPPFYLAQSGLPGAVGERPIAVVVVKIVHALVQVPAGSDDIEIAVMVEVIDDRAAGHVATTVQSEAAGHIGEGLNRTRKGVCVQARD